ncbi:MAG TPA: hypothetical protein VG965_02785 [Patescibacteria group bacterium]|nr:hypothetical protein [Patescibacteria group bacterium]
MDVQNAFYILGIVFMAVMLILLIGIIAFLFYIKAKINQFHKQVNEKIDLINNVAGYTGTLAGGVGGRVIAAAAEKVGEILSEKSSKKSKRN